MVIIPIVLPVFLWFVIAGLKFSQNGRLQIFDFVIWTEKCIAFIHPETQGTYPHYSQSKVNVSIKFCLLLSIFYSIAFSPDFDHMTVVYEPVDDGGSDSVIIEGLAPVPEGPVGGQNN